MKKYILAGIAFTLPLVYPGTTVITYKPFMFAQLAVIMLSATFLITVMTKLPGSVRLFYVWCLVSTFMSRLPQYSAISFMALSLILLLYRYMLTAKKEELAFSYKYIAIAVCVQVFWIFIQSTNRDFVMNLPRDINMIFGTIGNKNTLAALFLFSVAPMYRYKKWSIILPIIGIMYCRASASMFALVGGMLFYLLFVDFWWTYRQKFMKFVIISGLIGSMFFVWHHLDNPMKGLKEGRLPIWNKVLSLMFEPADTRTSLIDIQLIEKVRNPWLGYGLGTFRFEFPKRLTIKEAGGVTVGRDGKAKLDKDGNEIPIQWPQAHNTYLQFGRESGLIGMFFLLLIPGMLFAKFIRSPKTGSAVLWMSAIVMICLNAIGNFPDRQYALMYYIMFTFAVYQTEVVR